MKKILIVLFACALTIALIGCVSKPKLYVLNWGDYMDTDLIAAFEEEYGVDVIYRPVGSNEEMATLLQAGSSVYDIVVPSDYMIGKLADIGLIQPIDFSLLPHFEELTVIPKLYELYDALGISDYVVPYAWGTIGILYDTRIPGLADYVETKGWAALFESKDLYDVGMYNSERDAVAAALLYHDFNVNSEDQEELALAETALTAAGFTAWGEDSLKSYVITGTLDMALVYSGDYFSEYYIAEAEDREITFDYFVPETTNVWMDGICIPTIAEHVALAHQFIDFFLRYENALANSDYIGYAPPYAEIYETMVTDPDYGYTFATFDPFPAGSERQMYTYGSDARSEALVAILSRARGGGGE